MHLRARARLRGASGWQLLEIEPGLPDLEAERAAIAFAVFYAPDRWSTLDLGDHADLATAVWQHIVWARSTLSSPQGRAAHDLRFPRPAGEEVKMRRASADEAEQAFLRGQRALAANDAFKAVSELAAAARRNPDEPDHDAYAAWARVLAEAARGGDKKKAAVRERANLEAATWGRRPRPRSLLALGLLCHAAGDIAFARLHLEEALAIDPRFVPARQALESIAG
jgi:tetratricopeptide (TPR) repeat protein